jgi:hypothetical protein
MCASRIANIRPNSSPCVYEVPKWLDQCRRHLCQRICFGRDAAPPTAPYFHQPPPNKINMLPVVGAIRSGIFRGAGVASANA